eukprot:803198-Pleurochrysis_carterae.AAC.1
MPVEAASEMMATSLEPRMNSLRSTTLSCGRQHTGWREREVSEERRLHACASPSLRSEGGEQGCCARA